MTRRHPARSGQALLLTQHLSRRDRLSGHGSIELDGIEEAVHLGHGVDGGDSPHRSLPLYCQQAGAAHR